MCKLHENLSLIVQKLHHLKIITTLNPDELKSITCNTECKKCMYGECAMCKDLPSLANTMKKPVGNCG